ncbi:MAG: hypothetical protein HY905_23380 [Deltaproteobacteria bacterium]|nr:hypothetical protein [Deltaproteobacteria bacterium]
MRRTLLRRRKPPPSHPPTRPSRSGPSRRTRHEAIHDAPTGFLVATGGAAAHRLTGYYRGDQTLLYFADPPPSPAKQLRLVPDAEGDVWLARSPGPLAFSGPNRATVHPLLVYADLIGEGHERARDAAAEVRRRFLPDLERDAGGEP